MTMTGLKSTDYYIWFITCRYSSDITLFVSNIITPCFLNTLSLNKTENSVYDRLDNAVSKYVHGFKYKLNGD